ncbi:MAG: hypothetical protein JXB85_15350 [Anaerolineales bacterium]|nr:hypothetical protein [Anaerolineales bacterium]
MAQLQIIELLDRQAVCGLGLVIMRKNRALEILPILAANQHPLCLPPDEYPAGLGELIRTLAAKRVLKKITDRG